MISARDYGGDGPPVLLLHGLGGDKRVWEQIALPARAVAVDLRGHGESGDGPWTWDAVLDDLEGVIDRFGLGTPSVVGHSLGGILAGMWARRHPDCPAAVSLDGFRAAATYPENYAGMPAERVKEDLARLAAIFTAQEKTITRPNPEILAALRNSSEFTDALPVFDDVTSPFLIVMATRKLPVMVPDFAELMDAYLAGAHRDLTALAARRPNITVTEIDASHAMVVEQPRQVAEIIAGFLPA
jgi:pimeloyl-ACP methyl ester carboxylesterase